MTGPPRYRLLSSVVLAFLGTKLAVLLGNLVLFPTIRGRHRSSGSDPAKVTTERVALLVPVRDEVDRLPDTLPGMLTAGATEIVVLDDDSVDGTAELIERTVARLRANGDLPTATAVRVLTGTERPGGWAGKTWACAQLADATDAEILVFCDADVRLAPGALAAVVLEMRRQHAEVFSVFPRQLVGGWTERMLLPLIVDVVLCLLPFPLLSVPGRAARSAATAHGALLAFTRDAYRRTGGFDAVRDEVVEDVAIARRTRRLGLKLGLALGGDDVRVRMYTGTDEVVQGLGRGLVPAAGGSRSAVLLGWLLHLLAYTVPVLLVRSPRWRLAAGAGILERLLVESKTGGRDWTAAALVCVAPVTAIPVVRQAVRRDQFWKGRRYS
ncbi:MAG: glycosyltransferase family 2 protein [Nakamurella sp.]